jgi:hypothetical protein
MLCSLLCLLRVSTVFVCVDDIDSFIQVLRSVGLWARDGSGSGFEFCINMYPGRI